MNIRSRIEWARMWGVLADHFGTVGSMAGSTPVAMHTVDCLRQLALKFLDKVCNADDRAHEMAQTRRGETEFRLELLKSDLTFRRCSTFKSILIRQSNIVYLGMVHGLKNR